MTWQHIKDHWPQSAVLVLAAVTLLWLTGCPPRARSPLDPTQKLTRAELAAQLDHLIAQYEFADADITQQEKVRTLIVNNALLMAQTGTINPLGLITGLAALYGVGSATNTAKNAVKKRITANKPPADPA